MKTDYESTTVPPLTFPYNKILGILISRSFLKRMCRSLDSMGIREVEVITGRFGIQKLEIWMSRFPHLFACHPARDHMGHYLDALANDRLVFTAVVGFGQVEQAVETVRTSGAVSVSHIGTSVISFHH